MELAASPDPRALAYERLRAVEEVFVYRFGSYRLLYAVHDDVEVLEVQRVGYGHSVY